MNEGSTIFSQLISFLPDREFRRCVERYRGDYRLRGLSCWEQFLAMAFAQAPTIRDNAVLSVAFYVIAGLGWIVPAMPLVSWMSRRKQ